MFKVPEKRKPVAVVDLTDDEKLGPLEAGDSKIQKIIDGSREAEAISSENLLKYVDWLEQAVLINRDHRTKFAKEPERFLESEANLDEELSRLDSVATQPELLSKLTACPKFFETLLPLLLHENSDISGRVVALLEELVEMDERITPTQYDDLFAFCEGLLQNHLISFLVENLERLDESNPDDTRSVFNTLSLIEALIEVDPGLINDLDEKSIKNLQGWLVKRYYSPSFPGSKQNRDYAAELSVILLQSVENFQASFLSSCDAVDLTLAAIAPFKNNDPSDADEIEYLENLFDIICTAVLEPKGKEYFLQAQGIEFVLLLLTEINTARIRALKLLSYITTGADYSAEACKQVVELLGLGVIFPIFMGKGESKLAKLYKIYSPSEEEDYVISIISSLILNIPEQMYPRLAAKFVENEGEKTKRIVALHEKYFEKIGSTKSIGVDEEDKLLANLFTLRNVDIIIAFILSQQLETSVTISLDAKQKAIDVVNKYLAEIVEGPHKILLQKMLNKINC